jgi:hypothetical protein
MSMQWIQVIPGLWRSEYTTNTAIDAVGYLIALRDGELAVVSPPSSSDDAHFAQTDAIGKVVALVANNSGHDLGQRPWQAQYPDAVSYAPEVTVPQITKAKKDLRPLQSLLALQSKLPANVRFVDVAGTKSGMTLFTVDAGKDGRALFVDEILSNSPGLIGPLPFKILFRLTGSGPGLARNKIWSTVFAKDKKAVAQTVLSEIERFQPTVVLPAHGNPIGQGEFTKVRELLGQM